MHGLQVSCSVIRAMRLFIVFPSFRLSVTSQSNYENSRVFINVVQITKVTLQFVY